MEYKMKFRVVSQIFIIFLSSFNIFSPAKANNWCFEQADAWCKTVTRGKSVAENAQCSKAVSWCSKDPCNFLNMDGFCFWKGCCVGVSYEPIYEKKDYNNTYQVVDGASQSDLEKFWADCESQSFKAIRKNPDYDAISSGMGVVGPAPSCFLKIVLPKPEFEYTIPPCEKFTVKLTAKDQSGWSDHQFEWSTSDGQAAQGKTTEISFEEAGTYKITLTIDKYSVTKEITFDPPKLEIIDLACESKTECKGAFLYKKGDGTVIPKSPTELEKASVKRSGIVTDGITKLLLRMHATESVEFSIADNNQNCNLGTLKTRDLSSSRCDVLKVEPENVGENGECVFAVYESPKNSEDSGKIKSGKNIEIQYKPSSKKDFETQALKIYPPPVLLVHGLWSEPKKWGESTSIISCSGCMPSQVTNGLKGFLENNGYKDAVFAVDYKNVKDANFPAAESFDPQTTRFGVPQLKSKIEEVLKIYREKDIAISQVDVVGHSMGGLIARSLVKYTGDDYKYRRLDNYMQGDFNKLITIGTPHHGTRVADLLVHGKCREQSVCAKVPTTTLPCNRMTLEDYFRKVGKPVGPAVYDLQTGSTALKNLGETKVPAHAIVGIAPVTKQNPTAIDLAYSAGLVPDQKHTNLYLMQTFGLIAIGPKGDENLQTINELFGGADQHDTTVSVASQRGGLTGQTVTQLKKRVTHTTEPESPEAWNEILALLREPEDSPRFAKSFPAPNLENRSNLKFEADRDRCARQQDTTQSGSEKKDDNVDKDPELVATFLTELGYLKNNTFSEQAIQSGLKEFQKDLGKPQTGKLDEEMWSKLKTIKLTGENAKRFPDFATSSKPESNYTDKNPELVRAFLIELGYLDDIATHSDQIVQSALKNFQKDLGQSETGNLDEETWSKLKTIKLTGERAKKFSDFSPHKPLKKR